MKGLGAETRILNTATKPWLDRDPPGNHCPAPFRKAHSGSTQKSSWARGQSLTEQVSNDPGSYYDFWVSIWTWASHENVNKPSSERSITKLSFLTLAVKCNETCQHSPTYPSSDKTARACTDPMQAWISVALHETSETQTFSGNTCKPKSRAETLENKCVSGRLPGGEALFRHSVHTAAATSYPYKLSHQDWDQEERREDHFRRLVYLGIFCAAMLQWLVLAHGCFIKAADISAESFRTDRTVTARRVTWPRQYLSK